MYHIQRPVDDWKRAVEMLPDGALIKAVDQGDVLRDAKAINPNLITMLRHVGGPQSIFWGDLEANRQLARDFFETFIDETFRTQYAAHTDLVQEWNEYADQWHSGEALQARLTWAEAVAWVWANEYRTRPEYAHIRLALLSWPVGNNVDRRFAEIALRYDCVLSYHAYDKYLALNERDPGSWQYHCGRWHFLEQAWGLKPDWVFGEAGPYEGVLDGWRSNKVLGGDRDAYVAAVRRWIREMKATPAYREGRIKGFALFTTGRTSGNWDSYYTEQPELDMLAAMIREEWTPVVAPPTEPDPPTPERVIDYVDELPDNTASAYYPYDTRPLGVIDKVIIHHSVGLPTNPPESINIGHHNRGWPRIGYHYYIHGDGRIYKTNLLTTHSFHASQANRSSIGVCLAGDFTSVHPSPAQLDSARYLLQWINATLGNKSLLKHRDVVATACPGATWAAWWPQLTEEPEEPRTWSKLVYLLPQQATRQQYADVADIAYPTRSEIAFSADSAFARPGNVTGQRVIVYDVDAWGGRVALEDWIAAHYAYDPATVIEYREWPGAEPQWASPVGTDAERASGVIWPGQWFDATGYATWYEIRPGVTQAHTGSDLNLNSPTWDSDRGMPVHAASDGVVTYARLVPSPSTWGRLVVIDHGHGVCTRYAHMATMLVSEGDTVACGDIIGTIGGAAYGLANHLHFDISVNGRLLTHPTDWPGTDRARVLRDYADPKAFLAERV